MRGRGLKLKTLPIDVVAPAVAPRAGAWIETPITSLIFSPSLVAPRAGAWIETLLGALSLGTLLCRSPCGGVD